MIYSCFILCFSSIVHHHRLLLMIAGVDVAADGLKDYLAEEVVK